MTETSNPDAWEKPQNILVVLAHPDDPEFFCGATLARWARAGHHITYFLLTCGDKGFNDTTPPGMTTDMLCSIRHEEQANAAKVIGAQAVHWLEPSRRLPRPGPSNCAATFCEPSAASSQISS